MSLRDLMNKLDMIAEAEVAAAGIPNPYRDPAQAAKFSAMSDADQRWLTKGGGVPDITDQYILARAPNKGQPDAAKSAAAQTAATDKATASMTATADAAQKDADASSAAAAKEKLQQLNALIAALTPAATTTPVANQVVSGTPLATQQQQAAAKPGTTIPAQTAAIDTGFASNAGGAAFGNPNIAAQGRRAGAIRESMSNQLMESFGYSPVEEGIAGTIAGRAARFLPGVGLAYGAYDAYDRAKEGDYTGAAMAGLAGATSLVPGVGTAISAGLDAANIARDYKAGKFSGDPAATQTARAGQPTQASAPTGTTTKGDPKVYNIQQELIKKGAKITADGIMGPNTRKAMQAAGMPMPTVAEDISSLRSRLEGITAKYEPQEEPTTEGVASNVWQGAKSLAKNFGSGAKGLTTQGQRAAAGTMDSAGKNIGGQMTKATGAERMANKAGAVVGKNPYKATAAGAGVGAAAGLAMGGGAAGSPQGTTVPTASSGQAASRVGATTRPVAQPTIPAASLEEINMLMAELSQYDIPEIQQGLVAARAALVTATGDASTGPVDKTRTPAQVQASADLSAAGL